MAIFSRFFHFRISQLTLERVLIKKFTCLLSLERIPVSHGQPAEHLVQALLLIFL